MFLSVPPTASPNAFPSTDARERQDRRKESIVPVEHDPPRSCAVVPDASSSRRCNDRSDGLRPAISAAYVAESEASVLSPCDSLEAERDGGDEGPPKDNSPPPPYDSSGRTLYASACKMFNQVPSSQVLRALDTHRLSLRHHGLGPEGTKALCVALLNNTHVKVLDLEDNGIETAGALHVARMLDENYYITDLNLSGNNIGPQGALALAELLKESDYIYKLNIASNNIGDRVWTKMSEALAENNKLNELNLSNNQLGASAAEYLAKILVKYDVLKFLNLSWNHIRNSAAITLCAALRANTGLIALDLSYNGLCDDGAAALGEALRQNRSLQDLDLTSCRIGCRGAALLARALATNSTLALLEVGLNNLRSASCLAILRSAGSHHCGLRYLSFGRAQVDPEFENALGDLRNKGKKLAVIHGGLDGAWSKDKTKCTVKSVQGMRIALAEASDEQKSQLLTLLSAADTRGDGGVSVDEFRSLLTRKELGLEHQAEAIMTVAEHYAVSGQVLYGSFEDIS